MSSSSAIISPLESFLGIVFNNTGLLHGSPVDFVLAGIIAVAFPLARLVLDRTLFDVRNVLGAGKEAFKGLLE
jgi:hypothetical protein